LCEIRAVALINLPLPKSSRTIWLLTAGVIIGFPATSWIYFPALLKSGALLPKGDSIAILMFGSLLWAVLLTPIALGITFFCVRRYVAAGTVFVWRRDRPALSFVLYAVFGVPAATLLFGLGQSLVAGLLELQGLWAPHVLICMTWFVILRAAALFALNATA
jgi:hypothetical protein